MTSRAALTVIRHGATLASGLMRSGSFMKPLRADFYLFLFFFFRLR